MKTSRRVSIKQEAWRPPSKGSNVKKTRHDMGPIELSMVVKLRMVIYFILEPIQRLQNTVARWYISQPKVQIWVIYGGPWKGKAWYIL
jgi:hypothetical protein